MKSTGFDKEINDVLPYLTHIFGERLHDQKQENFIPVNYDEYQASPSIFFKATKKDLTY
ncbi:MAG: hypothetical protein KAV87_31670 [Desulfobacteraceae bacterium]|nr:hypothetical protein [Desulfobacteraceae bacterium]